MIPASNIQRPVYLVKVSGDFTMPEELELLALGCRQLICEGHSAVSLDLEKCAFIASRMCGMLVGLKQEADDSGVRFSVTLPLDHPLRDVLRVVRLDTMIRVFTTIGERERALTPANTNVPLSRVLVLFARRRTAPGFADPVIREVCRQDIVF